MTTHLFFSVQLAAVGLLTIFNTNGVSAAEQIADSAISFSRHITFELTFDQRDLVWLGDPASPTASVYPKKNAHPIATDICVTTLVEDHAAPRRRYFREARIANANDGTWRVYAFTSQSEKLIGSVDAQGRFVPNGVFRDNRTVLPSWPIDTSLLHYDANQNALYLDADIPGPLITETLDFLPLDLSGAHDEPVTGHFSIDYQTPAVDNALAPHATVALTLQSDEELITLATAIVPSVFRGDELRIGSFNNKLGTYHPEAAYRAGAANDAGTEPSVTVTFEGRFTSLVRSDGVALVVNSIPTSTTTVDVTPTTIAIDGNFDDWRNVAGVDDPRGDLVPYLEYVPDVDLLEFKVANDDTHIYFYARVAGQVGRSNPNGGRGYFYAYMDVDRDPDTGFLPSRDDDCYFGVTIGDDCEVQFEFVDNQLLKTFYGFCGLGGNDNVLKQVVTLGKSQYGRFDHSGHERADYKVEYIYRDGATVITEDLKPGTSDTIHLAVSPDGSEVEVVSTLTGFLKNALGEPTIQMGQSIDLAAGMECDSKAYMGKTRWAADSTPAIQGFTLVPTGRKNASN